MAPQAEVQEEVEMAWQRGARDGVVAVLLAFGVLVMHAMSGGAHVGHVASDDVASSAATASSTEAGIGGRHLEPASSGNVGLHEPSSTAVAAVASAVDLLPRGDGDDPASAVWAACVAALTLLLLLGAAHLRPCAVRRGPAPGWSPARPSPGRWLLPPPSLVALGVSRT